MIRSYIVWSSWLGLFLILELAGLTRTGGWVTLSETAQHAEREYPLVWFALFGFLIGLGIHIVAFQRLWLSLIAGYVVAVLPHLFDRRLP